MDLRCIVADDEPLAKMLIENYINRTPGLTLAGSYTSAAEAQRAIEQNVGEVAFLDIQMPGISGLQLAHIAEDTGVRVVFTTAYRDYALDGFRLNALDYLLKPISYEEFLVAANRAKEAIEPHKEKGQSAIGEALNVRSNYRTVRINFDDILYIEGVRDYVKIHFKGEDRPVLTQMSMKSVAKMLPKSFIRVHRSYIVRIEAVKSFNHTNIEIESTDGATNLSIAIGPTYRANFIDLITKYQNS